MFVGEDLVSSLFSASREAPGSILRRRDGIAPPHDQDILEGHSSPATMLTLAGIMQAIFNRPMAVTEERFATSVSYTAFSMYLCRNGR